MNRLDMGRVKMVKGVHACKINDLFLSCATGTLRNLSLAHHTKHAGKDAEKHGAYKAKGRHAAPKIVKHWGAWECGTRI